MQNRRITALLLTAFLVAEVVWHWQTDQSRLATTPGVWSEVAVGAYQAAGGGFLVPDGRGPVLSLRTTGVAAARPQQTYRIPGERINIYAYGTGALAVSVALRDGAQEILARMGQGFVAVDGRQNLWGVDRSGVHLLVGGQVGPYSRDALMEQARATRSLPRGWRLLWVADPVVVGEQVWYISNRDQVPGSPDFYVWQHGAQGDARISALDAMAPLDLLAAGQDHVFAEQRGTTLIVLDARSDAVLAQMPDTLPLTIAPQGSAALLEEFAGNRQPRLAIYVSAGPRLLPLPRGVGQIGAAAFSPDGRFLCLLVQEGSHPAIYVARLGPSGIESSTTIDPPGGVQLVTAEPPSEAGGRIFVVVRTDGQTETWSRSLADGQGTF